VLKCIDKGNTKYNEIALTFDDGPNPYATSEVLNILRFYNVQASFFLLGRWAELYPNLTKRIASEGHLIGNHSYAHIEGGFIHAEKILCNILNTDSIPYIRPPYFKLDWCSDIRSKGAKSTIVLGDVDSEDYLLNITEERVINNVCTKTTNGSIITFHDGSEKQDEWVKRPRTMLNVLPKIIEYLNKRFMLVRIDQLRLKHMALLTKL